MLAQQLSQEPNSGLFNSKALSTTQGNKTLVTTLFSLAFYKREAETLWEGGRRWPHSFHACLTVQDILVDNLLPVEH